MEQTTLSRHELYERVWKEPMTKVAEGFGLSDRGLAKLCERNGIPVPPRGYWAKKAAGEKVVRPPLLDLGPEGPRIAISPFWKTRGIGDRTADPDMPDPFRELAERERETARPMEVPSTLRKPHAIVEGWLREDEQDRARWSGLGGLRGYSHVSIYSSPIAKRRLRIISALLRALEARGFVVEQDRTCKTDVWVRFERDIVKFDLRERIRQKRQKVPDSGQSGSGNAPQRWTQTREPTGELVLKITSGMPSALPSQWKDEAEASLEGQLHLAVVGFIVAAAFERQRRELQAEAERRRWQEAADARKREEQRQAELARERALRLHAGSWRRAAEIRQYVEAVRSAANDGSSAMSWMEFERWALWALAHANELDPIVSGRALTLELLECDKGDMVQEQPSAQTW